MHLQMSLPSELRQEHWPQTSSEPRTGQKNKPSPREERLPTNSLLSRDSREGCRLNTNFDLINGRVEYPADHVDMLKSNEHIEVEEDKEVKIQQ